MQLRTDRKNMKTITLLFITLIATTDLYAQTTWYVSTTGLNSNLGTSASNAFATVNKAISVSSCGDSIYVLGGFYHEKINAYSICPDNNRIIIQGDISSRPLIIGDSTATNKYAISASGQGFTFRHLELTSPYPNICSQSNMVVVGSGDYMSFIDVIIRNAGYDGMKTTSDCSTSAWANNWKVIDCQIINNGIGCPSSIQNGDGIDFTNCHNCQIIGTSILNNKGHQLQIKLEARNVTVENCRIEGNLLVQIGLPGDTPQCDTAALNADSVFLRHNIIIAKGDTSEFIFKLADVSNLVIENNTVIKDSISSVNVGFICFGGCGSSPNWTSTPQGPLVIRNNIFANMSNTLFYAGPDTSYFDPFGITSTNVTDNYNLFYDVNGEFNIPVDGGGSSIVANPLFCDYPNSFELKSTSLCINAGDPTSPLDPDATQNDIGAKYYQTPCVVGIINSINVINSFDIYPNPAHQTLNISFSNNQNPKQQIQIYNTYGELIKEVEILQTTQINISNLPSGLYFIHLKNDPQLYRKIIKL
jgi:hypothetical protein